jgi:GT2 family glycosyltransferase
VVILHWGSAEVTARCLRSLAQASLPERTMCLLIDNTGHLDESLATSVDGLQVKIYHPDRNLGFAVGCQWGISVALSHDAEFVLLLNNDVEVEPSFLDALLHAAAETPEGGLLCPEIVSASNPRKLWYAGGSFNLWSGIPRQQARVTARNGNRPREVDYATGCALLVAAHVVRTIGSFNPEFFMYCEDLDLSLRARQAGFKVLLVPAARVCHSASDEPGRVSLMIYYSTRNLLEVMRRHAAWYHWPTFVLNFLVRWLGFFTVLAVVRGRARFIPACSRGVVDFLRGRLGERVT